MKSFITGLIERIRALPKMRRFSVFVAIAAIVGAIVSVLTWLAVFREPALTPVEIALVAPLSGPEAALGQSLRDGAEIWIDGAAGQGGRPLTLKLFDSAATPDAMQRAASDAAVVAVVSLSPASGTGAASVPVLPLSGAPATAEGWSFPLSAAPEYETRFLSNYIRNILGEKLISIVRPDDAPDTVLAAAFDETLQRFGTRVVYQWPIAGDGETRRTALAAQSKDIASRQIAGAILVLGDPEFAADAVAALRAAEVPNRIIGARDLATNAFLGALRARWHGPGSVGSALNNTLVTTPVLFDTAGVDAQAFQAAFRTRHYEPPDWVAVLGHDGARAVSLALAGTPRDSPVAALRAELRMRLANHKSAETALPGLMGPLFFEQRDGGPLPTLAGRYDGENLVAAETQLTPIRDDGVADYLEQLAAGRILYVNDRFMYKTNVVSAGIQLNKITDLKPDTNTANLEFMMWFRWRGNLTPNDIVFANAATPIVLGPPERSQDDGDRHYRAWRVRGQFFLNSAPVPRSYNSELVDITFRHRSLARNNLMYVDDVVGMDLAGGGAAAHDDAGWLSRLFNGGASRGSARRLREQRVLAGAQGWIIDQALISQQLARAGSDGDPSYVGFGKPQPLFSHISMDVVLAPDEIDIGSLVSTSILIYLAIFALSGATLAHLLDRRDLRHFWRVQTLFLRLITWPVLLGTGSVLALNYALANTSLGVVEAVDFLTRAAWWLVPARLLALIVERFIWTPLEMSTGRRVPTVFRIVVAILIYGLAMMGVIAFVMGKTVTSLLATSGLLTLIFGLAVQSNLKDIFSGVMLNLERPFGVNDWVRINRVTGQVHDISWRTTRLRTSNGEIVAFANGKVVDAEIENMSRAGSFDATAIVHMDPRCVPERVIAALKRALETVMDPPYTLKRVILQRVENEGGVWAARYVMDVRVPEYGMRNRFWGAVWPAIWHELEQAGLTWGLLPHSGDDMPRVEALREVAE